MYNYIITVNQVIQKRKLEIISTDEKEVFIMTNSKDKLNNAKDKVLGEVKETAGKVTGNKELELKGKMQSIKADINNKGEQIKDSATDKINTIVDENKVK